MLLEAKKSSPATRTRLSKDLRWFSHCLRWDAAIPVCCFFSAAQGLRRGEGFWWCSAGGHTRKRDISFREGGFSSAATAMEKGGSADALSGSYMRWFQSLRWPTSAREAPEVASSAERRRRKECRRWLGFLSRWWVARRRSAGLEGFKPAHITSLSHLAKS